MGRRIRCGAPAVAVVLIVQLIGISQAGAAPPPDHGTAFEPRPLEPKLYAVQPPDANPALQIHNVKAADGVNLYVETWLPKAKDGHQPPARIPTVLVMTPYVNPGQEEYPAGEGATVPLVQDLVTRGYAVAQHHVRGSGASGGCLEQTATHEPDDGARVVEYLGRDAPWSDGNVGMFGISYDAETQIGTAAKGDPAKTKYLKAIIPAETIGGSYEYEHFDGVPYFGHTLGTYTTYLAFSMGVAPPTTIEDAVARPECQHLYAVEGTLRNGNFTSYWADRELRTSAQSIKAATLLLHGHADWNVKPIAAAGLYDRIPATTPKKGIFGYWEHAFPNDHFVEPDWIRPDFMRLVLDWYDHYLRGRDTGVDEWPDVQVQGSDGQWRAEPDWPTTGGPAGQLALGQGGVLGVATPAGATDYDEAATFIDFNPSDPAPVGVGGVELTSTGAQWETPPLAAPLQLTGQPVLDAWIQVNRPGGHLTAKIEALNSAGEPMPHAYNVGYRSLRHLDPIVNGAFTQAAPQPAPVDTPLHVLMRFHPNDFVVPKGGRLRLSLAGTNGGSQPSLYASTITVLHDCAHPTALRFLMPTPNAPLLNVREPHEKTAPLSSVPALAGLRDGGGLASAPVCGVAPLRNDVLGAASGLPAPAAAGAPVEQLPATGYDGPTSVLWLLALGGAAVARRRMRATSR